MHILARPPTELEIVDDPKLDIPGHPELNEAGRAKEGDLFQLLYVVKDGKAVLVTAQLLQVPR